MNYYLHQLQQVEGLTDEDIEKLTTEDTAVYFEKFGIAKAFNEIRAKEDPYTDKSTIVIDTDYDQFMITTWCLDYEEKNTKKEFRIQEPSNEQTY